MRHEILNNDIIDVLMIQETKLNDTFPVAQFAVDRFKMYINDYTEHSGRLMMHVKDDQPQRRRDDLEGYDCESGRRKYIVTEIMIQGQK